MPPDVEFVTHRTEHQDAAQQIERDGELRQQRAERRARGAHRRRAQLAEDEDPVEAAVEHELRHAAPHHHRGAPQPAVEVVARPQHGDGETAVEAHVDVLARHALDLGRGVDPAQHRADQRNGGQHHHAGDQGQIEALEEDAADPVTVARAVGLRGERVDPAGEPPEEAEERERDHVAEPDRGQRGNAEAPHHDGVDDAHHGVREVGDDHRSGDPADAPVGDVDSGHVDHHRVVDGAGDRRRRQKQKSPGSGGPRALRCARCRRATAPASSTSRPA